MIYKILVIVLALLATINCYSEENGILILKDEDLNNITAIFPNIFIKYYVPWYTCNYLGVVIVNS
jgi:hypothetical protein